MLSSAISKISNNENLSEEEARVYMNKIMSGGVCQSQVGGFLMGLKMKGETIDEITGCARAMRENAVQIKLNSEYAIDTCGTGGDGGKTFNISTAVALIAATAGIKVAKHGNRAVSGKSGSADVLEELGFELSLEPEKVKLCIDEACMGFIFAPKHHSAMKNVAGVRKELGIRTIFNILGPLTNPAFVQGQVLGVYDEKLTNTIAQVLLKLGSKRAMVVHGNDGLDEITTTTTTKVSEVREGKVFGYLLDPQEYGFRLTKLEDISGGDARENARIILDVLKGKKGPKRDIVVLNSAAALYIGKATGSIKEGVDYAKELIDSGAVYKKLNQLLDYNRSLR